MKLVKHVTDMVMQDIIIVKLVQKILKEITYIISHINIVLYVSLNLKNQKDHI